MKAKIFITVIIVLQTVVSFSQMNISFSTYVHTPCDTCVDLKANVTGGTAPYTYQWHAKWTQFSAVGQNIVYCNKRPTIDSLVLTVTDANSQQATLENGITQSLSPSTNTSSLPVCIVTVDSATGKNLIVWQQTTNPSIVSYNLYKMNSSSVLTFIKNIPKGNFSTYIDNASNPAQVSAFYNISMIDSCGFESPLGSPINTIHLTVSAGISPSWNLSWNSTQGFSILKYRIWRATTIGKPVLIDSVATFVYAYTDLTPPTSVLYYIIEAISNTACNPSKTQSYSSSFSNVEKTSNTGINSISDIRNISVYPNPSSDNFFIDITSGKNIKASISLLDIYGKEVHDKIKYQNHPIEIDASTLSEGIYFVHIKTNEGMLVKKVTVQKY